MNINMFLGLCPRSKKRIVEKKLKIVNFESQYLDRGYNYNKIFNTILFVYLWSNFFMNINYSLEFQVKSYGPIKGKINKKIKIDEV